MGGRGVLVGVNVGVGVEVDVHGVSVDETTGWMAVAGVVVRGDIVVSTTGGGVRVRVGGVGVTVIT